MTPFALLEHLAGLSHREAAEFHGVRIDTVKKWSTGDTPCKPSVLAELRSLIERQELAACAAVELGHTELDDGPADDAEARLRGWPCVGAWSAMAARVLAKQTGCPG